MAHHQGMTLVALANALLGDPMVRRFHADPRVQATELLLQERVPRDAPITQPRPVEETRRAGAGAGAARAPLPLAAHAVAARAVPVERQLRHRRHQLRRRRELLARPGGDARSRRDATRDPGSQFLYLRDVRSGAVWSATLPARPTAEPDDYVVTFLAERASFRRRDDEIATQLDVAVSPEDDVEVRRLAVTNHSDRPREIEITSYAEIVLASPADDLAHPAFGKLFVETEYLPERTALLCRRRPRAADEPPLWAVHVLSLEGRTQGPVEWETDRARFLGRGRATDAPRALDGRSLSGTTGVVLDPIVSLRQRIRLAPGGLVRLSFATGIASSRDTALALAQKYHEPSSAARTFALAFAHAQSALRHLGITSDDALLYERLASRVLYADRSLRAAPGLVAKNELGQEGLWPHAISGDLPILLVRVVEERRPAARAPGAAGPGVLAAQGTARRRRDPERASRELPRRDARPAHGARRQRPVAGVEAQARRCLSPARRPHGRGRARAARGGGARRAERRSGRPEGAARARLPVHWPETEPAELRPTRPGVSVPEPFAELPPVELSNGLGGFADDGRDYVIILEGETETPQPWANVIANPEFGTIVTAAGLGVHLGREQP